jgi:hypothetical protein
MGHRWHTIGVMAGLHMFSGFSPGRRDRTRGVCSPNADLHWGRGWLSLVLLSCVGCSFISSAVPVAGEPHAIRKRHCDVWHPLVDAGLTLSGAVFLYDVSKTEHDDRSHSSSQDGSPVDTQNNGQVYSAARYAAYTEMAVFAASAIWGAYVSGRCAETPVTASAPQQDDTHFEKGQALK